MNFSRSFGNISYSVAHSRRPNDATVVAAMLSKENRLGSPSMKLSSDETGWSSKKNWKVTSLPSLLNQSRKHPDLTKYMERATSPSRSNVLFAATSRTLNRRLHCSHASG